MIRFAPWWVVVLAATLGTRTVVAQEARSAERLAARSGSAPGSSLACPARRSIEGVSLAAAWTELHYRSGVDLVFSAERLPSRLVSCNCRRVTVATALNQLLAETQLTYMEMEGQVLIFRRATAPIHAPLGPNPYLVTTSTVKPAPTVVPLMAPQQTSAIAGQVTDSKTGQGVAGVDILLLGTKWRATTSVDGRYLLPDLSPGSYTLLARRIGYRSDSRAVTVTAGQDLTVDVVLQASVTTLQDVVVTAQKREERLTDVPVSVVA